MTVALEHAGADSKGPCEVPPGFGETTQARRRAGGRGRAKVAHVDFLTEQVLREKYPISVFFGLYKLRHIMCIRRISTDRCMDVHSEN